MTFQAYCPFCEKTVAATTLFGGNELKLALDRGGDVEVMHTTDKDGDHRWHLIKQEKENLRKAVAKGLL